MIMNKRSSPSLWPEEHYTDLISRHDHFDTVSHISVTKEKQHMSSGCISEEEQWPQTESPEGMQTI